MLTYTLSRQGGCSLYEQLYRCIREDILSGRLAAGEKLPSKRMLAEHLNVSVVTVENAYAQLMAEGYLFSRPKRGFFVERLAQDALPRPALRPTPAPPEPEPPQERWFADLVTNQDVYKRQGVHRLPDADQSGVGRRGGYGKKPGRAHQL